MMPRPRNQRIAATEYDAAIQEAGGEVQGKDEDIDKKNTSTGPDTEVVPIRSIQQD